MTSVDEHEPDTQSEEETGLNQEELTMDTDTFEEKLGLLEGQPQVTVKSKSNERVKLCYLFIIVLLLVTIATGVALVVSLTLRISVPKANMNEKLTLDDVFDPAFQTKGFSGSWTSDGQLLHLSQGDGVILYNPVSNDSQTLVDPSLLSELRISAVKLSSTGKFMLLIGNTTKIYRHSFLGNYYIHNLDEGTTWLLGINVLYGEWSPANDILTYVVQYDIYTYDTAINASQKYTTNGMKNEIYNGVPDWVYEEEVLSSNYALWWSPDGQSILYFTFNDSQVEQFQFPIYGPFYDQYTEIDSISYPKAGHNNPTVKVYVLDITNGNTRELIVPQSFDGDHYVLSGGWIDGSTPVVSWMNREQNKAIHCSYNSSSICNELYTQTSLAWVEVVEPPLFSSSKMFIIDSYPVGSLDSYLHLTQIDIYTGETSVLTSGQWEVTDILGINENTILYISTQTNIWQRHIYSYSSNKCLTCDLSPSGCTYWSGTCSSDLSHCLLQCSGPVIPFTVLVRYNNDEFSSVVYFERNEVLYNATLSKALPTLEIIEIPDDEVPLYGRVLYPPNIDKSCNGQTYPVLFYVYGGPYSQMIGDIAVTSRMFIAYLSSQLDVIVVSIDGRGTGFRGNNFKYAVYHQLGILETEDQLKAAKYMHELCYTNSERFTIYGSSYGGYMAGMVGATGSFRSLFNGAISQSPVTDWIYYDSIYTERYMGTPSMNPQGYEVSSLLGKASNISLLSHFLLIHGTGDDNVHFQNTAQLVNVLTEDDIQYELMFYTDQDHSLSGGNTRHHLYQLITDFLML